MSALTIFEIINQDKNILIRHKDTQRTFVFNPIYEYCSRYFLKKIKKHILNGDFSYILKFESFTIMIDIRLEKRVYSFTCDEQIVKDYAEDNIILMKHELAYLRHKVFMFEQQERDRQVPDYYPPDYPEY